MNGADVGPELIRLLGDKYGVPFLLAGEVGTWRAILGVYLRNACRAGGGDRLIGALRESGLLEAEALAKADPRELSEIAESVGAGFSRECVATLQRLASWADRRDADRLEKAATDSLREELRAIPGLGPKSVDQLLLEGLGRVAAPVDRASYRILVRHGWIEAGSSYEEAGEAMVELAGSEVARLISLNAWFAKLGRESCKPSVARCLGCPLETYLPAGGPLEPER